MTFRQNLITVSFNPKLKKMQIFHYNSNLKKVVDVLYRFLLIPCCFFFFLRVLEFKATTFIKMFKKHCISKVSTKNNTNIILTRENEKRQCGR